MVFSINSHEGEGAKGTGSLEREKRRERKEKEEKRSRGAAKSQPRIIPYITSLANLVPCATDG